MYTTPLTRFHSQSTEGHNGSMDRHTVQRVTELISHTWNICIQQLYSYYEPEEAWWYVWVTVSVSKPLNGILCVLSCYRAVHGAGSHNPSRGVTQHLLGDIAEFTALIRRHNYITCRQVGLSTWSTWGLWVQSKQDMNTKQLRVS